MPSGTSSSRTAKPRRASSAATTRYAPASLPTTLGSPTRASRNETERSRPPSTAASTASQLWGTECPINRPTMSLRGDAGQGAILRQLFGSRITVRAVIEAVELTKDYGRKRAVDGLSFTVRPGIVTGFLGPNGSGKSTTMRLILGLDRPTRGSVTVNGKHYRDHVAPLHEVGALPEARSIHTGRSAY